VLLVCVVDGRKFLWDQERQLWDEFQTLDRNGDGVLDSEEMRSALEHQGVELSQNAASDLVRLLSGTPDKEHVTFTEFRDFLILLPRRATPFEIYKFYQVHKRFSDGRGAARVNMDGDPILSFPKAPGGPEHSTAEGFFRPHDHDDPQDDLEDTLDVLEDEDEDYYEPETRHEAWRFLLAGGIAGGVSRSVTAPFDRLKVYLMTMNIPQTSGKPTPWRAAHGLMVAVRSIYNEGAGIRAFWVGNGLNVLKIFPESAIKFVSYEQSKRFLAKYWDGVNDPAEISSSSRFIAGGIGGITSQLAIYGLETLKTRVQSNIGPSKGWRSVQQTASYMWREGGFRPFYRGLGVSLAASASLTAARLDRRVPLLGHRHGHVRDAQDDVLPAHERRRAASVRRALVWRTQWEYRRGERVPHQPLAHAFAGVGQYGPPPKIHGVHGRAARHAAQRGVARAVQGPATEYPQGWPRRRRQLDRVRGRKAQVRGVVGVVTWWWCPRRDCSVPAQTKLGSVGRRQSWHSHHRTCIAFHHAA
jgi:hypothetical protein